MVVKLKRHNKMKYCPNCKEVIEIVMVGNDGFCPKETTRTGKYLTKLYTIDAVVERRPKNEQGNRRKTQQSSRQIGQDSRRIKRNQGFR